MSTPSKMVVDRSKSTDAVLQAAEVHGDRMVTAMASRHGEAAGEATRTLLAACVGGLRDDRDVMVDADRKHTDELSDDAPARQARDAATVVVYDKLVDDREVFNGIVGGDYVQKLGFVGPTPEQPHMVLATAQTVARRLRELPTPASRIPDVTFAPKSWAKGYDEPIADLEKAIANVGKEEREAEATLVDKQRAIDAHDRTFASTAALVSLLLEVSGEPELARRVRPSTRRPGVTAEVGDVGRDGGAVSTTTPTDAPVPA